MFYADVQVFGEYPRLKLRELEKNGLMPKMEAGDLEIIRANTVDFVSFSYYMTMTELTQTQNALRAIRYWA